MNRSDTSSLSDIAQRLPEARKNLSDALGNLPSNGPQNGSQGVCTNGGPTARIATARLSGQVDQADHDNRRLDQLMARLHREVCVTRIDYTATASQVVAILDVWAPTEDKAAKRDENLRAAADDLLNTVEHNHCQSHLRVGSVEYTRREGGRLCRWCEDWVRWLNDPDGDWGNGVTGLEVDMPPEAMVRARVDGRKIDRFIPPRKRSRASC